MAQSAATTAVVPTGPIEDVDKPHTHTHTYPSSGRLEDQAALAALYVTKYDTATKSGYEFLDGKNKLSSAGAAASLKYANPQDLPGYPSAGLKKVDSAAGAAASLGWANQKPFEHWKPDPSASASAAAMSAKDYKMAPLWQPEQSAHGAKAALLAHKDGGKVDICQPEATIWGNSAAAQAFKKYGAGQSSPVLDYGYTEIGRKGSMMAATGAMSNSRKRAESNPIPPPKVETYPDEANAASNALKAATSSVSSSKRRSNLSSEKGAVPYTTMSREMFTNSPPAVPEVEEKNRNDTLHASAVAMARGMYALQQKQIDAASSAQTGAVAAHGRRPSTSASSDIETEPMRFTNLQEAAQKLAQERLAKLHDEHAKNREYRDYYGSNTTPSSRLSIRGRTRRRASSDGTYDEDKEQSNKIRAQMSLFSSNLSQVDAKKRQQDREALIAVAQRNVTKSLHGMDEKVFADTGKVAPSLLTEWEMKAHAAAQAKSDTRMENYRKVDIGGGKFISQSAVNLVAQKNVQPVLDEINEKAEVERERQATLKAEQEENKRKEAEKKTREKEGKEINKKLKQQDKDEEKLRRAEEKAGKDQQKRLEKEQRKSGKSETATAGAVVGAAASTEAAEPAIEPEMQVGPSPEEEPPTTTDPAAISPAPVRTSMEDQASMRMQENADAANRGESTPMSPTSPSDGSKVKNWLKTKFSRRGSKTPKSPANAEKEIDGASSNRKSFVGGAALTGASVNNGTVSLGAKSSSIAADKGKETIEEPKEERGRLTKRHSEVSAVSSLSKQETKEEDEEFQEARDNFDEDLAPPPTFPAEKSSSPVRDSKFTEVI